VSPGSATVGGSLYCFGGSNDSAVNEVVYNYVQIYQPSPALPTISNGGIVNGASFQPGIIPGSWVTIQGSNLSTMTGTWDNFIESARLPGIRCRNISGLFRQTPSRQSGQEFRIVRTGEARALFLPPTVPLRSLIATTSKSVCGQLRDYQGGETDLMGFVRVADHGLGVYWRVIAWKADQSYPV
jgi:hypothetical protein